MNEPIDDIIHEYHQQAHHSVPNRLWHRIEESIKTPSQWSLLFSIQRLTPIIVTACFVFGIISFQHYQDQQLVNEYYNELFYPTLTDIVMDEFSIENI